MSTSLDDAATAIARRAALGDRPLELVSELREVLGAEFRPFTFVYCFQKAFNIPLSVLREAENWTGFGFEGGISNEAFESLLARFVVGSGRTDEE